MRSKSKVKLDISGVIQKYNSREDFEKNQMFDATPLQDRTVEIDVPEELVNRLKKGQINSMQFLKEVEELGCLS